MRSSEFCAAEVGRWPSHPGGAATPAGLFARQLTSGPRLPGRSRLDHQASRASCPGADAGDRLGSIPEPFLPKAGSPLTPLERDGFELPVLRAMQARLKAKIDGFGCIPSSIIWGCRFRAR